MKREELLRNLRAMARESGCLLVLHREGASHEIWRFGSAQFSMPRHKDIKKMTAKEILKRCEEQAGRLK